MLHNRKSLRAYSDKPVSAETRRKVLEAAISAPTAGALMLYAIIEIEDEELKKKLAVTCDNQPFIARAPWVVVFAADYSRIYDGWLEDGYTPARRPGCGDLLLACEDAIIAAQTAVIAAEAVGLGSCYIGDIMENAETHKELLNLPDYVYPAAMLCFGYPPENDARKKVPRLPLEQILHTNAYRRKPRSTDDKSKRPRSLEKFEADFTLEMNRSAEVWLKPWLSVANAPLRLDGTYNTRELGGYKTADGRLTQRHRLLRSDALDNLSDGDLDFLYDYGVRCVVDLRSKGECDGSPSRTIGYKDMKYFNVPMLDHVNSNWLAGGFPDTMGGLYVGMLKNDGDIIASVLRIFLEHTDGCVLFNCTAGKDRTGTIAMLTLLLAGVSEETVVADYAISRHNLEQQVSRQLAALKAAGHNVPAHVFDSAPAQMQKAIDFLNDTYGGVKEYLKSVGLSGDEIVRLGNMLF